MEEAWGGRGRYNHFPYGRDRLPGNEEQDLAFDARSFFLPQSQKVSNWSCCNRQWVGLRTASLSNAVLEDFL